MTYIYMHAKCKNKRQNKRLRNNNEALSVTFDKKKVFVSS